MRETAALGQVVVIDTGPVRLDVGARRGGRSAVDLHPTVHDQSRPTISPKMTRGPPEDGRPIYAFVACVPTI